MTYVRLETSLKFFKKFMFNYKFQIFFNSIMLHYCSLALKVGSTPMT